MFWGLLVFILATADGRKGEGLSAACGLSGQVWRVSQGNCWRMWSVGSSMASGSRGLLAECGLSGQVWRVGQENCWRSVVCRGEIAEWVKKIVGGVWSVGGCGLSGRKGRVGQEACRRVWSVGSSMASGSRELLAECGLSGQVWRVSQEACRWVWSVGAKMLRGSKGLSLECGLSA